MDTHKFYYHSIFFRLWASKIPKTFSLRYNRYTECIETLDDKDQIMNVIRELKGDMDSVEDALEKIC